MKLKHWPALLYRQIGEIRPRFPHSWLAEDSILDVFFHRSIRKHLGGTNWYLSICWWALFDQLLDEPSRWASEGGCAWFRTLRTRD